MTNSKKCGFQGIDKLNTPLIKQWLFTYLLYNQRFKDEEEKNKAVNDLYVKAMLFFEATDMRVNEKNIANPDIAKKIMEFAKNDIKDIDKFLKENKVMEEQAQTKENEKVVEKSEITPQSEAVIKTYTDKKPCSCREKQRFESPTTSNCIALAILGALIAYVFVPSRYILYVLIAIGLILMLSVIYKNKKKHEK